MVTARLPFIGSLTKNGKKAKPSGIDTTSAIKVSSRELFFDLFTHISYMAALATARVSRAEMFSRAARLKLASARYFLEIQTLADRLGFDYAESCRLVGERISNPDASQLLLRMSGSLSAGEDEAEFLTREARVMAAQYEAQYEADIESMKKWTDAYVALSVSAVLIVVVTIVSTMIYSLGASSLIFVVLAVAMVTGFGAWVIRASAPREAFTRVAGLSSAHQLLAWQTFKISVPLGVSAAGLVYIVGGGLGWTFIAFGVGLIPPGFIMNMDARKLDKRDNDLSTTMRLLGGVTSAMSSTVADALNHVDKRSMASLEPNLRRLQTRMNARIDADLCWARFVLETGSEMIDRTVRIFWDAIRVGGDADQVGQNTAFFASTVTALRMKRALVANTFQFLVYPLHGAVVGLLIFIINVMALFGQILNDSSPTQSIEYSHPSPEIEAAASSLASFGVANMDFLNLLIMTTVIALTIANSMAISFASGGHWMRSAFNLGVLVMVSGVLMVVIPGAADGVFDAVIENQ